VHVAALAVDRDTKQAGVDLGVRATDEDHLRTVREKLRCPRLVVIDVGVRVGQDAPPRRGRAASAILFAADPVPTGNTSTGHSKTSANLLLAALEIASLPYGTASPADAAFTAATISGDAPAALSLRYPRRVSSVEVIGLLPSGRRTVTGAWLERGGGGEHDD
jgi:hypothetical protein